MAELLTVLGIETSCDETAAAVVSADPRPRIRANLIRAQLAGHAPYGGDVPEFAARAHLDHIEGLIDRALADAGIGLRQVDGIGDDDDCEAFDKCAKLMEDGYRGWPAIEQAARDANPARFSLPRPLRGRSGCDFSFSGLKTAVRQIIADRPPRDPRDIADLAAAI